MVTIHAFKTEERARIHSLLFASAAEGLVVTDRKGCICLINPRMNELFGYEGEALLGQSIDVLLPQAMRARHAGHRADYMASPRQRSMGSGYKLLGQRSDGTVFPVEVSLNHLTVDGEVYAMGLVTDITLRKQAEEALQRTNAELEQRVEQRTAALLQAENELRQALEKEKELNALKSRFVSMASHEFRTPLSTILSSVDLIGRYTEGQDKVEKHVERIRNKVRELTAMLNEFLSLDKLEQGLVACNPERIDLIDLCVGLIEEMRDMAKPGQAILFDHEGDQRELMQDRQMLRNVMSNLLSNAIKYSPAEKRISLHTQLADGELCITVRDEGMGIPLEDQQHLFERFFRASNAMNMQGTGLGLNIVKKYLDLMGGTITFTSAAGEGTTFTVQLPQRL